MISCDVKNQLKFYFHLILSNYAHILQVLSKTLHYFFNYHNFIECKNIAINC